MRRLFACFMAAFLFGGGLLLVHPPALGAVDFSFWGGDGTPDVSDPTPSDGASDDSEEESGDDGSGDEDVCDRTRVVADYIYDQGFAKRDFIVGANVVDWDGATLSHTDQAFTRPLRSKAALENFLDSDSASAAAARIIIGDDLVVDGDEWVVVQFRTPIEYSGNWHWNGRRAIEGGTLRASTGDIWWLNVGADCEVEASDSIRAACGNAGLDWIEPARLD